MFLFTNVLHSYIYSQQELAVFQDSLHTLKMAQGKFQDSKESLEKITPQSKGKSIMVPLTGSVSFNINSRI